MDLTRFVKVNTAKRNKSTSKTRAGWPKLKELILEQALDPRGELSYTTIKKEGSLIIDRLYFGINTVSLYSYYPTPLVWAGDDTIYNIIVENLSKKPPVSVEVQTSLGPLKLVKQNTGQKNMTLVELQFKKAPKLNSRDVVFIKKPEFLDVSLKNTILTYEGSKISINELSPAKARILGDLLNYIMASKASVKRLLKCLERRGQLGLLTITLNDGELHSGVEFFIEACK